MKKIIALIVIHFTLVICVSISFADEYDYKHLPWGLSQAQVVTIISKTAELTKVGSNEYYLEYEINNTGRTISYSFGKTDQLRRIYCVLKRIPGNTNDILPIYERYVLNCAKSYGEPAREWLCWSSDELKDMPQTAFRLGDVKVVTTWYTHNTRIDISMFVERMHTMYVMILTKI